MKKVIKSLIAIAIVLSPFILNPTDVEAQTVSVSLSCSPTGGEDSSDIRCVMYGQNAGGPVTGVELDLSLEGDLEYLTSWYDDSEWTGVISGANSVIDVSLAHLGQLAGGEFEIASFVVRAHQQSAANKVVAKNIVFHNGSNETFGANSVEKSLNFENNPDASTCTGALKTLILKDNTTDEQIDFDFSGSKTNYSIIVPYSTSSFAMYVHTDVGCGFDFLSIDTTMFTTDNTTAPEGFSGNGTAMKLDVGENTIKFKGGTKTYTLNITRQSESESEGNGPAGNEDCTSGNCNGESGTVTKDGETVEVPDTATTVKIWYYIAGAVFMVFGVYLIVEARKMGKKQK